MRKTMKKFLVSLCSLLLIATTCVPAYATAGDVNVTAATWYHSEISFAAYTEGAVNAFDGDATTAYAGSITGQFATRSVLSGLTLTAGSTIYGLLVSGSEDGVNWIDLYEADKVENTIIFGHNGSSWATDLSEGAEMYSYSWQYIRIEIAYGSIADVVMYGYAMDVVGNVSALDITFNETGWKYSKNYYADRGVDYMDDLTDHILGVAYEGPCIDATEGEAYGWLILKTAKEEPLSAISFMFRMGDGWGARCRMAGVMFEGSEDGESWTEITTLDTSTSNGYVNISTVNNKNLSYIEVDQTKNYRYIKISAGKRTLDSLATMLTFGTIDLYTKGADVTAPANILKDWDGDTFVAEKPAASVETLGVQHTAVDSVSGKYNMRFVGTFAGSCADADAVGMKIVASWTDSSDAKQTRTFDATTTTVYTSLLGKNGSITQTIEADEGEYLYAITVNGIPTTYDVTFTITSYVEIGDYTFAAVEKSVVVTYDAETGLTVTPVDLVIPNAA